MFGGIINLGIDQVYRDTRQCEVVPPPESLRDRFAMAALAGQVMFEGLEGSEPEMIAGMCYEMANAMLKARGEVQP